MTMLSVLPGEDEREYVQRRGALSEAFEQRVACFLWEGGEFGRAPPFAKPTRAQRAPRSRSK
jgi:hypothetical protein